MGDAKAETMGSAGVWRDVERDAESDPFAKASVVPKSTSRSTVHSLPPLPPIGELGL